MPKSHAWLLLPVLLSLSPAAFSENPCPQGRSIEQVPLKQLKEHRVELRLSDDIVVRLVERAVVLDEKNRDYCKDKTVGLVNGTTPFGGDGNPRAVLHSYLMKLTLHVKNKTYDLDTSNMYNAWGNQPLELPDGKKYMAAHCYDESQCTLRGIFNGRGYVAEWQISYGKPFRTVLSASYDLGNFFLNGGINPPVFE